MLTSVPFLGSLSINFHIFEQTAGGSSTISLKQQIGEPDRHLEQTALILLEINLKAGKSVTDAPNEPWVEAQSYTKLGIQPCHNTNKSDFSVVVSYGDSLTFTSRSLNHAGTSFQSV